MTIEYKREVINQIKKIESEFVFELKNHILKFSYLFSDFEKLNFLKCHGNRLFSKNDYFYGLPNYKFIDVADNIIFNFDIKEFVYSGYRSRIVSKNDYRKLFSVKLNIKKQLKTLQDSCLVSQFKVDSKRVKIFFHTSYRSKMDFSYEDFNRFLISEITEKEFNTIKRRVYREAIFFDCKSYLDRNKKCTFKDFLKLSHLDEAYIREIFLEKDYNETVVKKTIEILNV